MKISTIQGVIDRRILINFAADPDVVQKIIPSPFKLKIYKGKAIVGICLIRLKYVRPKGLPAVIGISSENGAHRVAVQWNENGRVEEGVYIPRRDTSSIINSMVGGRLFPGKHFLAKFDVQERDGHYHIAFKSSDGAIVSIDTSKTNEFNRNSVFENIDSASEFFECGKVGYSPASNRHNGIELRTLNWKVEPLNVISVSSSFFENESVFPKGSVQFDNALLMTNITHEWHAVTDMKTERTSE